MLVHPSVASVVVDTFADVVRTMADIDIVVEAHRNIRHHSSAAVAA